MSGKPEGLMDKDAKGENGVRGPESPWPLISYVWWSVVFLESKLNRHFP